MRISDLSSDVFSSDLLSTENYNGLLEEFASLIAMPVAERFGWQVSTTSPTQGLDDWLDEESAAALRRFSAAANQATGSRHPPAQRRWFDFLISAPRSGQDTGPALLSRWLPQVAGRDQ